MEWHHLPVAGGLYDQDPQLLMDWEIVWEEYSNHQASKRREQERNSKQKSGGRGKGRYPSSAV